MDEVFLKEKVQRGKGKEHWPDEWVPSSLLCHIFALRHHKYELYVPLKMQPELDKTKKTRASIFLPCPRKILLNCSDCLGKSEAGNFPVS